MEKVTVNSRTYTVEPFNPLEGMRAASVFIRHSAGLMGADMDEQAMQSNAIALLGEPDVLNLVERALRQCITPEKEYLRNEAVFERWFSEHPEDMIMLGQAALLALVTPFFPKGGDTAS